MKSRLLPFVLLVALLGGCARQEPARDGASHDHAHHAPNGGTLVELGHHQFNLEFVHDAATGSLTIHLLNGHADDTVRSDAPELPVSVRVDGQERLLTLQAVANPLANERVGDTSVFSAQADWLKGAAGIEGVVPEITLRGAKFSQTRFVVPPAGRK